MALKLLGILGSPRRGGNVELLLDEALRGAEEAGALVEKVALTELNIAPCRECTECDATGDCTLMDDMATLYPRLRSVDRLILASPIYFLGVTAQTKAMIDRCQCLWVAKYVLKRPSPPRRPRRRGLFISAAAWRGPRVFEGAERVARAFFATLDVTYGGGLFYNEVDKKGDILKHPTAMKEAFQAGARLATVE